jgi:ribosomal protein S18 acetylase RimI-like enzyme
VSNLALVVSRTPDPDAAVAAITLAFAEDPVSRWAISSPLAYARGMPEFVRGFGGRAFALGTAYGTGDAGAALWLPPGAGPDEAAVAAALERHAPPRQLPHVFALMEAMGRWHPDEPHWYLPLIGVDPAQRGRGVGAALLGRALEDVDRDGVAAYLESTNPRNLPLYERHGFAILGKIVVEDSPPVFPMLRPAHR